MIIIISRH